MGDIAIYAAVAGQGINMETLQLANIQAHYSVGGSVLSKMHTRTRNFTCLTAKPTCRGTTDLLDSKVSTLNHYDRKIIH